MQPMYRMHPTKRLLQRMYLDVMDATDDANVTNVVDVTDETDVADETPRKRVYLVLRTQLVKPTYRMQRMWRIFLAD